MRRARERRARRGARRRPADRPRAPAGARGQRARDRPAVEREGVARTAEAAARRLERDSVEPEQPSADNVARARARRATASRCASDCTAGSSTKTMRSPVAASAQAAITSPQGAPGGKTTVPRLSRACALGRHGATARITSISRPAHDASQLLVVGDALAGPRNEHERRGLDAQRSRSPTLRRIRLVGRFGPIRATQEAQGPGHEPALRTR